MVMQASGLILSHPYQKSTVPTGKPSIYKKTEVLEICYWTSESLPDGLIGLGENFTSKVMVITE